MPLYVSLETNKRDRSSLLRCLRSLGGEYKIKFLTSAWELLAFIVNNEVDVAFVTSAVEEVPYVDLLKTLQKMNNTLPIVLMSHEKGDAYEALQLDLAGFLLKPLALAEVQKVLTRIAADSSSPPKTYSNAPVVVRMQTMPSFDMYIDGVPVLFKRKKTKELLAYLVNANGGIVTVEMIVEALWEGEDVGPSQRNRCHVLVNFLKNFLKELGIEKILTGNNGQYCLDKSAFTSDLEDLLHGDKQVIMSYEHRYLDEYSWSEGRKGAIERLVAQRE